MIHEISNSSVTAKIKEDGAELISFKSKSTNIEYMWNGNSEYWGRHAPVLFPIVGQVKNKTYYVDGKEFNLPQHGLARDQKFEVTTKESNAITFQLRYSEETLKVYPYKFLLEISYSLEGSEISTNYRVVNLDSGEMLFSIGGHPALNCPIALDTTFEDYELSFEHSEKPNQIHLNTETGLRNGKVTEENIGSRLNLNYDLFKNDAIIFERLKSKKVILQSPKTNYKVIFDFDGWEYLAFWTKKPGTPFICIEPWLGITDPDNSDQQFESKLGIQKLEPNKEKEIAYKIKVS